MAAIPRKTAEQRRVDILEAALTEFADAGFDGASTERIARRAGISQPYLFRLFGTKKQLFITAVDLCFSDVVRQLRQACAGATGTAASDAARAVYREWLRSDPRRLRAQVQAVAGCADAEIRATTRAGFARLVELLDDGFGLGAHQATDLVGQVMVMNMLAMMELPDPGEPWAEGLVPGSSATA